MADTSEPKVDKSYDADVNAVTNPSYVRAQEAARENTLNRLVGPLKEIRANEAEDAARLKFEQKQRDEYLKELEKEARGVSEEEATPVEGRPQVEGLQRNAEAKADEALKASEKKK